MEDIFPTIVGLLFGSYVLVKSLLDVGKLPGGPARPTAPAVPSLRPAPISTAPAKAPGNGFEEEVEVLDEEEWEAIERTNRANDRIAREVARFRREGLQITNLETWKK